MVEMRREKYLMIHSNVGTEDCRPIEGIGFGDVDSLPVREGIEYVFVGERTEVSPLNSGDEYAIQYFDPVQERIVDRPGLPPLPGTMVPGVVDLSGLPDGTQIILSNEAGDKMEITTPLADGLTLVDAGRYGFEIRPPFPWLPLKTEIQVA